MNKSSKKALILVGSGDLRSHSFGLAEAISDSLKKLGAVPEIVNLIEYGLPLYDRSIERADSYDEKTRSFLKKSYDADIFVWITPIHHNSFSAILKNALDWQHTKFPGKIVGLASNGGGRSPQAVDQLMLVARAQHLINARLRVCTQESDYTDKKLSDAKIKERVEAFTKELVDLSQHNIK